jgi:hypothetical protein
MFSRFSGVSAEEYGRQTGQIPWVGGKGPGLNGLASQRPAGRTTFMQRPLARKGLGQVMTKPMCLCKMQRESDEAKRLAK